MVEVRLHGALAKEFGMVWNLDVASPREAVRAIDCARPGFRRAVMGLSHKEHVFRVRTRNHDYSSDDLEMSLGEARRIDIIPVILGASAGMRFVVGAALVALAFVPGFQAASPYLMATGVSMMIGSVVEWLTPVPKKDDTSNKSLQSWTVSGATNTVDQGSPVPVIYGEVVTGGYTISAGISVAQLSPSGSVAPSVLIGGELEHSVDCGEGNRSVTYILHLGAGAFNLNDPFTYDWTVSGFSGATFTVVSPNKANVEVRITKFVPLHTDVAVTGTVSISLTGKVGDTPTTVNKSEAIKVTFLSEAPYFNGESG